MQKKNAASVCDLFLDVISGVCTDEERLAFERHLPGCEACQAETEELRIVWEALHSDMERMEPPEDLKKQVMDAAIAAEAELAGQDAAAARRKARPKRLRLAAAALLLCLFIAGTAWNVQMYQARKGSPLPIEEALSVPAAQIRQLVSLKPQSEAESKAYGVACVVDNGQSKQFVVYVFDAAATNGNQAYQVWLIKDGVRQSAGTFRVQSDGKGIGVLAMPIASDQLDFDKIGITLEPDDKGDRPRGEKMFGSA